MRSRTIATGCAVGLAYLAVAAGTPASAATPDVAEALSAFQARLDMIWLLVAAGLVLLMQVGFMLLEAGMVRSKNAVSVAQKNLLDFCFSVAVFGAVGFMFAFGASSRFFVGLDPELFLLSGVDGWGLAFFVFQAMFCGTAATIISGAVAERMRLPAYVLGSVFIAGLVYPVFVHWAWGNALIENAGAFLANMGFVDFAGSTVVHGTGAWMALAACIVIGPRRGKFDANGNPVRIHGHSQVLATTGAFLLFVGWFGFNGGSTLSASPAIAHVIANTVIAAAMGTAAGYLVGWRNHGVFRPEKAFSGMLGGLVAVTAGCMVLTTSGAVIVGFAGGAAAIYGIDILERQFKIDDAVGAVGIHGVAGVVGTLGLALLAPVDVLPAGDRLDQLMVQATGVALNFVWAFGLGLVFFSVLSRVMQVRVDADSEEIGLNEVEHGTKLGVGHVEDVLVDLADGHADLSVRLPVAPGDDTERLARLFNRMMESMETEEAAREIQEDMRRAEEEAERLSTLANSTFEAILISSNGIVIDGNAALGDLVGVPLDELKGTSALDFVHEKDRALVIEQLKRPIAEPYEVSALHVDGTVIPVEIRAREMMYQGKKRRVSAIVDLRERKRAEERIRYLAQHDPLTDLPNRALFAERLDTAILEADKRGRLAALLIVDLDRFKDVNDVHGHLVGDCVIKKTAERLKRVVRKSDTVARLGGDEFAIIQNGIQFANQATDLAHRLVGQLSRPIDCGDGIVVRSGASIGVAVCPLHGADAKQIISRADTALYQAKSLGRNTHAVFEEGMDAAERHRRLIEADLARAVDHREFELYLQPRLGISRNAIQSYEALIRWNHPDKGLIGPNDFIPVAEQSGKIVAIGSWVMAEACRIASKKLKHCNISVNVSPLQFRDKGFLSTIETALSQSELAPDRLEIEVTESVLIEDDARALQIFKSIKELGCRISLDDFGTGYSSLGYLSRFPFDCIKIDRSFVHTMRTTRNSVAIVETIIRLGRALGMKIVAEGVETSDELLALAQKGCDEVQGYLIGRPRPVSDLPIHVPSEVSRALASLAFPFATPAQDRLRDLSAEMREAATGTEAPPGLSDKGAA